MRYSVVVSNVQIGKFLMTFKMSVESNGTSFLSCSRQWASRHNKGSAIFSPQYALLPTTTFFSWSLSCVGL